MPTSIDKTQNNINFWWILSITLFVFSLTFFGISVYVYNNYFKVNSNEVIDDNSKLNDIINPNFTQPNFETLN